MRGSISIFVLLFLFAALPAQAATGRVMKVLPHFLDLKGRHTLSPSLYERDSYQAYLREHPEQRSGIRVDVQWKARRPVFEPLELRLEVRGAAGYGLPAEIILRQQVEPGVWSRWTSFLVGGTEYQAIGQITSWRVTLWEGERLVHEQKSFLWQ